ncbi:MAG: carbohydrate binding family 9 domain-containing protein [Candidatus Aminicenantes bacterium]|nr:carbohydrate binding family 9 domain-containing protein [Candidatus Aminicenantes bacterium]
MNRRIMMFVLLLAVFWTATAALNAVELDEKTRHIVPDLISSAITIDGQLTESVWKLAPISRQWFTFSPTYGEKLDFPTDIWLVYDRSSLYFAFRCHDPEPDKIKTSMSKRDSGSNDDWIGVAIDGLNNRQSTFEFYINPSGVQMDGITTAMDANNLDAAHDFIWESAARIDESGYTAEIRIPLESLRFKGGAEVAMGMMFFRHISRLGRMGSWPEIKVGRNQFHFLAAISYHDLKKALNLELLPSFTLNRDAVRHDEVSWQAPEWIANAGLSLKYGLSSAVTAEATLNPDFSQVESDAFQVEVNQRYPVFYSEKRPFFMEGVNVFDFGMINNGMMLASVYTRFIADPDWAAKLSGTAGKVQFALLAADDRAPGLAWEAGENPDTGRRAYWGLFRLKYSLGSDNSLGLLYSGRSFAGSVNQAAGVDLQYRLFQNLRLMFSYLHSETMDAATEPSRSGNGFSAMAQYSDRRWQVWATGEIWDRDFAMASAFLSRSAINRGQLFLGRSLYPRRGGSWWERLQASFRYEAIHDLETGLNDRSANLSLSMYTRRNGYLGITFSTIDEGWAGHIFSRQIWTGSGRLQACKWLFAYASLQLGEKIYYAAQDPFLGSGSQLRLLATVQPSIRLNLDLEYIRDTLSRRLDGSREPVYEVQIVNLAASYQFNRFFFVRGALRYDDYQKQLLTDFLASFTLIPGTVIHLGYGSLYESRYWLDDHWIPGRERLREMKNSLFFKVSYLWRIH